MHPDRFRAPAPVHPEELAIPRDQALQRLMETTDYVSQRALQLDEQIQEVEHIVLHLSALARQMRRLSQQIGESNDQLGLTLRSYTVSTGELRQTAISLLDDARAVQESSMPVE